MPAIIYLLLLLPAVGIARQQPLPSFARQWVMHYDDENGLFSNDVTGFDEDQRGYFWFSTQSGVLRFDGKEFRHYHSRNVPTLKSNRIYSINRDARNNLLFPDETTGVHLIQQDGSMTLVAGAVARHNFLMSRHGYLLDMRGYLKGKDSTRIMHELLASKYYTAMQEFYPDAVGNAWFVSGEDINYFSKGWFSRVDRYDLKYYQHFFVKNTLFTIDSTGYIQAYRDGKKTGYTTTWQRLLLPYHGPVRYDRQQARFCSNRTGAFLQYQDKIYAFDFDGQTLVPHLLMKDLVLPPVKDFFYSVRYNVYIATTSTYGFYLMKDKPFNVHGLGDGMENSYTATVEIQPMKVFTSNGVLFTENTAQRIYPPHLMVTNSMLKDRRGQIWFIAGNTLFCMNNQLREQKRWILQDTYLASILEDEQGIIWCSTNNGLMKIANGQLQVIYANNKTFDRTQCMFFLDDTTIWLGATDGLFAVNKRTGKVTAIEGMKGRYVRHIYRAGDGSIWISTYGDGFFTYRQERFVELPQDRMGYLAYAHCFMEDDKGFFWIPTNKGLFQVPKTALEAWLANSDHQVYYHYYDKNDGFGINEFNGGCSPIGIRLQDGSFSFPSMRGLVWFKPLQVKPVLPVQGIYIERVMADTQEIVYADKLTFRPGFRKMSFRISSPYFGNRVNFLPEYRVVGFDQLWGPVPADNIIAINYLPAGSYTLEVRLRKGFAAHEYTTRSLPFIVEPHWYEGLAFRLSAVLLTLSLISALIYWYFRRLTIKSKEREQDLERQVQERTREQAVTVEKLEETVEELKASREELHQSNLLKDKLTSVILHDIRSPLRFINLLSKQLYQALRNDNNEPLTALALELKKSSDQLDNFTREFLVWLTSQQDGFRINSEHVQIQDMFREAETFFSNILNWNGNKLELEAPEDIRVWTDRQLLRIILYNLLDNANKHTENGTIRISAYLKEENMLEMQVSDTGKGMTYTELELLHSRLEDEKSLYITDSTGNLGYRIIRDFVTRLRGSIIVDSLYNKGTTITLTIPVS